jgi:hypothetical protein
MEDSGLKEILQQYCRVFKESSSHFVVRCPYCGDSVKSIGHAHLYIKNTFPHPWLCHRCNTGYGAVNRDLLERLDACSKDGIELIQKIEKVQSRNTKIGRGKKLRNLSLPIINRNDVDENRNILFLENRLGFSLNEFHFKRYKIITNLYNFLTLNKIDRLTVPQNEADRLAFDAIGFLSADHSHIIFRNTNPYYKGRRYTNYNIFNNNDGSKLFSVSKDVDPLKEKHHIIISEGIIDLIQIENLYYQNSFNDINYIAFATNGSSHKNTLRWIMGMGILDYKLELYIDNEDGYLDKIKNINTWSHFLNKQEINIFKNIFPNEKDFGIKKENINKVRVRL